MLTEFVPETMTATGVTLVAGTTSMFADLNTDVSRMQVLNRSSTGVTRFGPVLVGRDRKGGEE